MSGVVRGFEYPFYEKHYSSERIESTKNKALDFSDRFTLQGATFRSYVADLRVNARVGHAEGGESTGLRMPVSVPQVWLSAEREQMWLHTARDVYDLLDVTADLYRASLDRPDFLPYRRILENGTDDAANNPTIDLLRKIANKSGKERTPLLRFDVIGRIAGKLSGPPQLSEWQSAMGGLGLAATIADRPGLVGGDHATLRAVIAAGEDTRGLPRDAWAAGEKLTIFISKGLEAYGHEQEELVRRLNVYVRKDDFAQVIYEGRHPEVEATLQGVLIRIGDVARFQSAPLIPLLQQVDRGALKVIPPLNPGVDASHLAQVLLWQADAAGRFVQEHLGVEKTDRLRAVFPRSNFAGQEELTGKDKRSVVLHVLADAGELTTLSGGRGVLRGNGADVNRAATSTKAFFKNPITAPGSVAMLSEFVDRPSGVVHGIDAKGEKVTYEQTSRRANPFFVRRGKQITLFAGLDFSKRIKAHTDWKVGASNDTIVSTWLARRTR